MALGKPVVASNIEGYASVVTDGEEGLLVPPCDAPRLAQALMTVMSDKKLREQMGAKGKLKAREYSWEHVGQRVFDYYTQVIDKNRGQNFKE